MRPHMVMPLVCIDRALLMASKRELSSSFIISFVTLAASKNSKSTIDLVIKVGWTTRTWRNLVMRRDKFIFGSLPKLLTAPKFGQIAY